MPLEQVQQAKQKDADGCSRLRLRAIRRWSWGSCASIVAALSIGRRLWRWLESRDLSWQAPTTTRATAAWWPCGRGGSRILNIRRSIRRRQWSPFATDFAPIVQSFTRERTVPSISSSPTGGCGNKRNGNVSKGEASTSAPRAGDFTSKSNDAIVISKRGATCRISIVFINEIEI